MGEALEAGMWVCDVYRFAGGCVCTVRGCLCRYDFVSVAPSGPVHVIMHVIACPFVYVCLPICLRSSLTSWGGRYTCDPAFLWLSPVGLGEDGVCVWIICGWEWGCGALDQGIML